MTIIKFYKMNKIILQTYRLFVFTVQMLYSIYFVNLNYNSGNLDITSNIISRDK